MTNLHKCLSRLSRSSTDGRRHEMSAITHPVPQRSVDVHACRCLWYSLPLITHYGAWQALRCSDICTTTEGKAL